MDYTHSKYESLLRNLLQQGYSFQGFEEFCCKPQQKVIILRHDVDKKPGNALKLAKIEYSAGIKASYHFRAIRRICDPVILKEITEMGHEIAYHYEDLCKVAKNKKIVNRDEAAFLSFKANLHYLRRFYPVRVISMHGSPLSKLDNRDLWRTYSYKGLDINCEAYLDLDYSKILYLTDTGRKWNGSRSNIKDKIIYNAGLTIETSPANGYTFKSTSDIIRAVKNNEFPLKVVLNTHPQRWSDNYISWLKELTLQSLKNIIKMVLIYLRKRRWIGVLL